MFFPMFDKTVPPEDEWIRIYRIESAVAAIALGQGAELEKCDLGELGTALANDVREMERFASRDRGAEEGLGDFEAYLIPQLPHIHRFLKTYTEGARPGFTDWAIRCLPTDEGMALIGSSPKTLAFIREWAARPEPNLEESNDEFGEAEAGG